MSGFFATALDEVGAALSDIDAAALEKASEMIAEAGTVGLYGCGREGLQMRGLAMRLHHLGLSVGYVGEMTMPPLGDGDLLIVSAGPGDLASVDAMMAVAAKAGATTLLLTAVAGAPAAEKADHVLVVPAQTMASDTGAESSRVLPMGSVYEAALFFVGERLVALLTDRLGITFEAMRARHTNME